MVELWWWFICLDLQIYKFNILQMYLKIVGFFLSKTILFQGWLLLHLMVKSFACITMEIQIQMNNVQ